jgi:hypothetical protein
MFLFLFANKNSPSYELFPISNNLKVNGIWTRVIFKRVACKLLWFDDNVDCRIVSSPWSRNIIAAL